ncbi:trimeric intracellular cation channel family protein [Dactylosporangium cerinum]
MSASAVITILELAGLYVFATSGALMAVYKGFDVVGIVVLAMLTALGGGILRDLIIGATPPAAFTEVSYLVVPLLAAVVTFFVHRLVHRLTFTVLVFDAAGLGLFCVTGTLKALDFGLGPLQAVLLGITTAVGGGVLRDITARETPALVQVDTDLYAIPAPPAPSSSPWRTRWACP